ncbi:MAG: hypothetical protein KDD73_04205 [Anaerolineales bacterium]|nr:hypothetical protein [Anaerolineales bacterium]
MERIDVLVIGQPTKRTYPILPPGFAIGLVGLLLMVLAVVLTLQRDALLGVLRGGGQGDTEREPG